ncbi:Cobalamin-independent synthase, Catalytic domain [Nocardioides dokdonensis FR1436]|uniref:Cobalamin-independent synthase, Catalytic domain n=1 Tax=Nocardioides dokdonensis FR1436 TaxID=1300347 RepID=A0A1A9GKN7_9ACTN|nr:methionine synthase [Nocardioides dokdonensis]ANH38834.1 Cobalamin-independent synthase, Catalytic domain [Nocardioides dokdonensis FR1436]
MSVLATGIGSMPGDDTSGEGYREAVRTVLGELAEHAYVPEMPGRGPAATMTGRALAVVEGLDADLQPSGWRLTGGSGSPGIDHRRTRSLLAQDLDALEELGQGYAGVVKLQVTGPWTLAATVEKPRGALVLGDHGARRDLAEALAEGVRAHVRDVRRRMPAAASLVVQLDEPALPSVLAGAVPTASGFSRHRTVHPPEASALLEQVVAAIVAEDAEAWVHSCAAGTPLSLLRGAGVRGLLVDVDRLTAADHDVLAEALEAGETVVLGVVPATDPHGPGGPDSPDSAVADTRLTERVARWLDMLGLDPTIGGLGVSPACGLAGASPAWSRRALQLSRTVADNLANLG